MKETIIVMDDDISYSKKFCNQGNKLYGKTYNFLTFSNFKKTKEYIEEHKVESAIVSDSLLSSIEDMKLKALYVITEEDKDNKRIGKKLYIYKLQSAKEILDIVNEDICKRNEKSVGRKNEACKLILFYSPSYIKAKDEIIKKISKVVLKKKKVLIVDIDEFSNYKGNVGLSNVIYDYKENKICEEGLRREIVTDKDQDYIKSVTYPEDFNVINNIDLANIINEIMKIGYDYVFINADMSYVKCQYILNDADSIVLLRDKDMEKVDMLKAYLKNENQIDYKKITIFDIAKNDRLYMAAFCKQHFESKGTSRK